MTVLPYIFNFIVQLIILLISIIFVRRLLTIISKNKLQNLRLDLIRKNKRDYANSKMSPTGSTVPAECLWLIFETLMHRRRVSAIINTLTIIILFGYIEWLIFTRLI